MDIAAILKFLICGPRFSNRDCFKKNYDLMGLKEDYEASQSLNTYS